MILKIIDCLLLFFFLSSSIILYKILIILSILFEAIGSVGTIGIDGGGTIGFGVGVGGGVGNGTESILGKTFISNSPITFPGGDVLNDTTTVSSIIENPNPNNLLDFQTRHVKCPVASVNPDF